MNAPSASEALPDRLVFGQLRLQRVEPGHDESDRYETSFPGPGPLGVWLSRRSPKHQWCASFRLGCVAYSWDPQDALEDAHERAIQSLHFESERLLHLDLG